MSIVCLIIVPLFFILISFYFRFWMEPENSKRVYALFVWGLFFGVLYYTLLPFVSSQFDNKIAVSAVFVRSLLIDGLLFGSLFALTCIGLCRLLSEDDMHNKSVGATGAFGYICGVLTVQNILIFVKQEYTDQLLIYIPYILYIVAICAVVGIFYGLSRDSMEVWKKLIFVPAGMLACSLLTFLYSFVSFFQNWTIWIIAGLCLVLSIVFYFIDYGEYSE